MIASFVALLTLSRASAVQVIERPMFGAKEVRVAIIIKLPELDSHDWGLAEMIVAQIEKGPKDVSKSDLLQVTGGHEIECALADDSIAIRAVAPAPNLPNLLQVLVESLGNPTDGLDEELHRAEITDNWESLLHGTGDQFRPRPHELSAFWTQVIQPETITVCISGGFQPGSATAIWKRKTLGWQSGNVNPHPRAFLNPVNLKPRVGGFELQGIELSANSLDLPKNLLAMIALGVGKGGSLHRISRDIHGWSYRQESILWPTIKGWLPRLVVASSQVENLHQEATDLKIDLLNDIEKWNMDSEARAMGMADATLIRGLPLGPFYFFQGRSLNQALGDETLLEAYWTAKTGKPWNAIEMVSQMEDVSLDDLKAAAKAIVTGSTVRVRQPKSLTQ